MDQLLERIKKEIEVDPGKKGYLGKSAKEIADLMNSQTVTISDIIQPDPGPDINPPPAGTITGQRTDYRDAPVLKLIVGITGVPNEITEEQVKEALI